MTPVSVASSTVDVKTQTSRRMQAPVQFRIALDPHKALGFPSRLVHWQWHDARLSARARGVDGAGLVTRQRRGVAAARQASAVGDAQARPAAQRVEDADGRGVLGRHLACASQEGRMRVLVSPTLAQEVVC